jgi:hypothetical protein
LLVSSFSHEQNRKSRRFRETSLGQPDDAKWHAAKIILPPQIDPLHFSLKRIMALEEEVG